jgi:prepilin-type N-terminal cleavage/methylation domain-containing protein
VKLNLSNQRGFTLIEALVAMMVATVGLMAMAELMAVTIRMQQLGRNATSASRLAQDKIDELNTVGFGAASMACGGSLTGATVANHFDTPANANGDYTRRWRVSAGPDASPLLRTVTVKVVPTVKDRRVTSEFEITTIIRGVAGAVCP